MVNSRILGAMVFISAVFLAGCASPSSKVGSVDRQQQRLLQELKGKGVGASITIYPVRLGNTHSKDVAEVVGLMLEKGGMGDLYIADAIFDPGAADDLEQLGENFAGFVSQQSQAAEYGLYAEFLGSPKSGVKQVRGLIADRAGRVVWTDRQVPGDADFDKVQPKCPMSCCVLLNKRLTSVLNFGDSRNAKPGKMVELWEKKSGVPDEKERLAIEKRAEVFKESASSAEMVVFAARIGKSFNSRAAVDLASMINARKLVAAKCNDQSVNIVVKPSSNQQRVLWDFARAVREYIKKNPVDSDYALFADYMLDQKRGEVHAVHLVICDRNGDWVVVEFQNSHQAEYKRIAPESVDDCNRLVVEILKDCLG